MSRFSFCFSPIEIGLEFLISSRVQWIQSERKIAVKTETLQDLKFDAVPGEVMQKLNAQKKKMLDFLQIKMQMVVEGALLVLEGQQDILGKSRHLIGTLEKEPEDWKELPSSLKTFESAVLVGDISQRDVRKNKNVYQLRTSSVGDEVFLEWVNVDDLLVLNQKKADLDLVRLVDSVKLGDGAGNSVEDKEDVDKDQDDIEDAADNFAEALEPTESQ